LSYFIFLPHTIAVFSSNFRAVYCLSFFFNSLPVPLYVSSGFSWTRVGPIIFSVICHFSEYYFVCNFFSSVSKKFIIWAVMLAFSLFLNICARIFTLLSIILRRLSCSFSLISLMFVLVQFVYDNPHIVSGHSYFIILQILLSLFYSEIDLYWFFDKLVLITSLDVLKNFQF